MFGKQKIDPRMIVPTSKLSLKLSCLAACGDDMERAAKLYAYIADGIADLPDFDPVRPSGLQQIKQGADELLGWLNGHQEDIARGISLVRTLRNPSAPTPVTPKAPPIPDL
jgi:hypothetical protein